MIEARLEIVMLPNGCCCHVNVEESETVEPSTMSPVGRLLTATDMARRVHELYLANMMMFPAFKVLLLLGMRVCFVIV